MIYISGTNLEFDLRAKHIEAIINTYATSRFVRHIDTPDKLTSSRSRYYARNCFEMYAGIWLMFLTYISSIFCTSDFYEMICNTKSAHERIPAKVISGLSEYSEKRTRCGFMEE